MNSWLKGIKGLFQSRKGTLCLILFFWSLAPMTYLCFYGKLDSTAYAACMSGITVALTTIFCHTQSRTDQLLGTPQFQVPLQFPMPPTVGYNGNMGGYGITPGMPPAVPPMPIIPTPPTT